MDPKLILWLIALLDALISFLRYKYETVLRFGKFVFFIANSNTNNKYYMAYASPPINQTTT